MAESHAVFKLPLNVPDYTKGINEIRNAVIEYAKQTVNDIEKRLRHGKKFDANDLELYFKESKRDECIRRIEIIPHRLSLGPDTELPGECKTIVDINIAAGPCISKGLYALKAEYRKSSYLLPVQYTGTDLFKKYNQIGHGTFQSAAGYLIKEFPPMPDKNKKKAKKKSVTGPSNEHFDIALILLTSEAIRFNGVMKAILDVLPESEVCNSCKESCVNINEHAVAINTWANNGYSVGDTKLAEFFDKVYTPSPPVKIRS